MEWWSWTAAAVQAVLLVVLVLLYFDNLREKPGWSVRRAAKRAALFSVIIPIGVVAVLLVPLGVGLILIAVPAVTVGTMALAS